MQRRELLKFMAATGTLSLLPQKAEAARRAFVSVAGNRLGFTPVPVPLPVLPRLQRMERFEVKDALTVPPEYTYDVVCAWGDRVFADPAEHFGFNNDFTAFIALKPDDSEGLLWVNHEYVSEKSWVDTYSAVIGRALPAESKLRTQDGAPNAEEKLLLARAVLYDQGGSVVHVRRDRTGRYRPVPKSAYSRRISGIQGLDNPDQRLDSDGPAVEVFLKGKDGLGRRIIGTFANCSGGVTPWGTILTCEENFQSQVNEAVTPDGTPILSTAGFDPASFSSASAATLGLQANKYGWVVEIDPARPDAGIKHTALGRFRHENVALRALEGKPLACYMGDDRTGGHTYKFVSQGVYRSGAGKANSALLASGTLYVARYQPDGTGEWLPLRLTSPVEPPEPGQLAGGRVRLPLRPEGGATAFDTPEQVAQYKQQYRTLADLYTSEGAMLIDAFLAANAIGGTPTARPEDIEVHPQDGSLFIAYTSGASTADGGPDARIFVTASTTEDKRDKLPHGAIYRLIEAQGDPAAVRFRWSSFAASGEVVSGGAGFANPDNLCFDGETNLWVCSDIGNQNQPVPNRSTARDAATSGLFGSNTLWFMPMRGPQAGIAYPFATGPVECELTGPTFTNDGRTLFLAVQHPGEGGGWRRGGAMRPDTQFELLGADGKQTFIQTRRVPIGSNFPSTGDGPPKPCVVAVRKR